MPTAAHRTLAWLAGFAVLCLALWASGAHDFRFERAAPLALDATAFAAGRSPELALDALERPGVTNRVPLQLEIFWWARTERPSRVHVIRDGAILSLYWRRPSPTDGTSGQARPALLGFVPLVGRAGAGARRVVRGVPPDAFGLELRYRPRRDDGVHVIEGAELRLVRERALYRHAVRAQQLLAGVLCATLLLAVGRRAGTVPLIAIAAAAALIAVGVTLPESEWTWRARRAFDAVADTLASSGTLEMRDLYKGGHFAAFFFLGLVTNLYRARLALSLPGAAIALVLAAISSEALQLHLHDRSAEVRDLLIDLAGAACGVALGAALRARQAVPPP